MSLKFSFSKWNCGGDPHSKYIKKTKHEYLQRWGVLTEVEKRKGVRRRGQSYKIMLSHCTTRGLRSSLTLCSWRMICSLNRTVQSWKLTTCPSKIFAFLRFQIFQASYNHEDFNGVRHTHMQTTSLNPKMDIICASQTKLNFCQQTKAKEQSKKSLFKSSATLSLHMTQWLFGCTLKFLLCSISLVFSMSIKISQAKNLSLGEMFLKLIKLVNIFILLSKKRVKVVINHKRPRHTSLYSKHTRRRPQIKYKWPTKLHGSCDGIFCIGC